MKKKVIILSLIFTLIDQISKILVINLMDLGEVITIIPSFFYLTHVQNDGAALNILSGNTILLIIISLAALFYVVKLVLDSKAINKLQFITYTLLIGGIIGNILDRVIYGKVIDFLAFHIFGYHAPVFNLADSFIVISVILLGISIIIGEKHEN